jgi:hypothetical protein
MMAAILIGLGYVGVCWTFGWTGFAFVCLHVGLMLIATHRSRP